MKDKIPEITNVLLNSQFESSIISHSNLVDCTEVITKKRVEKWKSQGSFVVGNSGGYDLLSLNHIRGLVQARIIGAVILLGEGASVPDIFEVAGSDRIKLLISLDTNLAIEENKSRGTESNGAIRPLLDWETRAKILSLQSFNHHQPLVNFITRHGPNSCNICEADSCWHANKKYNVASTGVDVTVLKSIDEPTINRYPDSKFYLIDENKHAFFDQILEGQISTSAILKRIRSDIRND